MFATVVFFVSNTVFKFFLSTAIGDEW